MRLENFPFSAFLRANCGTSPAFFSHIELITFLFFSSACIRVTLPHFDAPSLAASCEHQLAGSLRVSFAAVAHGNDNVDDDDDNVHDGDYADDGDDYAAVVFATDTYVPPLPGGPLLLTMSWRANCATGSRHPFRRRWRRLCSS